MRKILDVKVTEWHIRRGVPKHVKQCALALAIGDALQKTTEVPWETVRVTFNKKEKDEGKMYEVFLRWDAQALDCPADLPPMASVFAFRYDKGLAVSPIRFKMPYGSEVNPYGSEVKA